MFAWQAVGVKDIGRPCPCIVDQSDCCRKSEEEWRAILVKTGRMKMMVLKDERTTRTKAAL